MNKQRMTNLCSYFSSVDTGREWDWSGPFLKTSKVQNIDTCQIFINCALALGINRLYFVRLWVVNSPSGGANAGVLLSTDCENCAHCTHGCKSLFWLSRSTRIPRE